VKHVKQQGGCQKPVSQGNQVFHDCFTHLRAAINLQSAIRNLQPT